MKLTKISSIILLSAVLFMFGLLFAQSENEKFSQAMQLDDPAKRIEALQNFIEQYPQSDNLGTAYRRLFTDLLDVGEEDKALEIVEDYLSTIPEDKRAAQYNMIAWRLAERGIGLEAAAKYAKQAEDWARSINRSRTLRNVLDTRALVLYQLGQAEKAEELQREALVGNEQSPDFLQRLAQYEEAAGKRPQALRTVAKALLFGAGEDALKHFNDWLNQEAASEKEREELKSKIIKETINQQLTDVEGEEKIQAQSQAAIFMARTGVDLEQARKWAGEAVASIDADTQVSDEVEYRSALAHVYFAQADYDEALNTLKPVIKLASPWKTDFWYMVGQTYERLGEKEKALNVYLETVAIRETEKIKNALNDLYAEMHGNADGLAQKIETVQEELNNFDPGHYQPEQLLTGKVVLAELFTGAECSPCQAADYAFDALAEYYPRNSLAILEHHLHIPAPDPLTNDDTESRYEYYGRNFGTPTVFINGSDKISGGGPKIAAKNRFNLYQHTIQKHLQKKPPVKLSGSTELSQDKLDVQIQLKSNATFSETANLHIALVEKSVDYLGSNGVNPHAFVVRKLIGGEEGLPINLKNGVYKVQEAIELEKLEAELATYLDSFAEEHAKRFRNADGWRARPIKLNRNDLAVIAWVQDSESKQVLQAFYQPVSPAAARK